jgi:hypothetical protein
MQNSGISGVALQSGIWFVVTAVGIAAMDGSCSSGAALSSGGCGGGDRLGLAHFDDPRGRGLNKQLRKKYGLETH